MQGKDHARITHLDTARVVVLYAVFASLWILISDEVIRWLATDPIYFHFAQTFKGLLFVGITSILLYLLLNHRLWPQDASSSLRLQGSLLHWPAWQLYLLAAGLPLMTLLMRNDLAPLFSDRPLMMLFMVPILVCAVIGGLGPGLFATLVSAVVLDAYILDDLAPAHRLDMIQLAILVGNGILISLLSMMLHQARYRTEMARRMAEKNLGEQEKLASLLNAIAEGSTDAIFAKDLQGRYLLFNRASEKFVGKPASVVIGKDDNNIFPPQEAELIIKSNNRVLDENRIITAEEELTTTNGSTFFLVTKGPLHDANGQVTGLFGISRDISYLKNAELEMRKQRDFAETLIDTAQAIVLVLDCEGRIVRFNAYMERLSGWRLDEVRGRDWFETFLPPASRNADREMFKAAIHDVQTVGNIDIVLTRDGTELSVEWYDKTLKDEHGNITGLLAIGMDVTQRQKAEQQIHSLAFYDSLTGLPNRARLLDRLGMMLPIAVRQSRHDALLLVNIDRFKNINDASGQNVGDELLKAVGARLSNLLREGDMLSRLSGDEFAILLPDLSKQQQTAAHQSMHVAQKIHLNMREPLLLGDDSFTLTVSIGIAHFPLRKDEDSALDILRRANTALHRSKNAGGGQTALFEHSMDETTKQRFQIESELRQAIPGGQLRLYLQPQVDASGRTVGAEALVRWQHPQRGLLMPGLFIPVAEESDLIIEIGQWVMGEVCKLLTHQALQGRPYRIAVNISPRQFRQPNFVEWVNASLAATGAEPTHLTIEVTEGVVIDNVGSVIAKMNELAVTGIHFSVDDFGTGYSSLAYLKRLPIHELKIDKTFVQDAPSDPSDAALIESILAVAKHMHLKIVAEGVETQEQADFLNQRGEVVHQGYLFGRPEPAELVLASLAD
ncbi:MAG: EAL domain-containing protein [Sideroxydans sp.]|nr:EAL domain-containing protein [Sideroxydans sp.]